MKPVLRLKPRLGTPQRKPIIGLLGDIATLLALSALCGCLLTLVRDKALPPISHGVISPLPLPLAMCPWAGGVAMALTCAILTAVVFLAVRKTRSNDIEAELRWSENSPSEALPLPPEDLRRIIWAVTEEVCTACEHVRKAQGDLSVEDYGEKLGAAERGLRGAITCLGDVMKRLNADAAGGGLKP